jgi:protein phosphatase
LAALDPAEAVSVLVDVANLRGGPDNITALVVRVASVPAAEDPPPAPAPAEPSAAAMHTFLWGATAACLVVSLVLATSGYHVAALVSALVGAAAAVAALVQSLAGHADREASKLDGPLGSGPHAVKDCAPNAELVAACAQLAQQLREATRSEHWTLDWKHFNALGEEAQAALAAGDHTAAVRHYALAINFMMNEIRRQAARKDHRDSSVLDL